jgi:hypothetical protein
LATRFFFIGLLVVLLLAMMLLLLAVLSIGRRWCCWLLLLVLPIGRCSCPPTTAIVGIIIIAPSARMEHILQDTIAVIPVDIVVTAFVVVVAVVAMSSLFVNAVVLPHHAHCSRCQLDLP